MTSMSISSGANDLKVALKEKPFKYNEGVN